MLFRIYILFILCFSFISKGQTNTSLKSQYDSLMALKQYSLAVNKAKEIRTYERRLLGDTSINNVLNLLYIANAFTSLNNDSSLSYYDLAINTLSKQNRVTNWLNALAHYNKGIVYESKQDSKSAINELNISAKQLEELNLKNTNIYFSSIYKLGSLYKLVNDYSSSIDYFTKSFAFIRRDEFDTYLLPAIENVSDSYYLLKDFDNAKKYHQMYLQTVGEIHGYNSTNYINALNNFGFFYFRIKQYDKALIYYGQVLERLKSTNYDDSLNLAIFNRNIANCKMELGQHESARDFYLKSYIIRKTKSGINNKDGADILYDLGNINYKLFKYQIAKQYYEHALSVSDSINGINNMYSAMILRQLGNLFVDTYDYDAAEKCLKRSKEIRNKIVGVNDPKYLIILNDIAILYETQNKFDLAETEYRALIELTELNHGKNNPELLFPLVNLGLLNEKQGRFKESLKLYNRSIEIYDSNNLNEPIKYINLLNRIGMSYLSMGYFSNAENYFQNAFKICETNSLNNTDRYYEIINSLGLLYMQTEDYRKSEEMFLKAISYYKEIKKDPLDISKLLNNLAILYSKIGNYEKSVRICNEVINIRSKLDLKDNLLLADTYVSSAALALNYNKVDSTTLNNLLIAKATYEKLLLQSSLNYMNILNCIGMYYSHNGEWLKERKIYQQILENKIDSSENKLVLVHVLKNMANNYLGQNEYEDAILYQRKSLSLSRSVFGVNSSGYLSSLNNLILTFASKQDYDSAFKYTQELHELKRKEIINNFQWMSGVEKENYIKANLIYSYNIYSVTSYLYNQNNKVLEIAFNQALLSKGILLESNRQFDEKIRTLKDTALLNKYNLLKQLKYSSAKLHSQSYYINDRIRELDYLADSLEKTLTRASVEYSNIKNSLTLGINEIRKNISKEEAVIEFVRMYNFKEKKFYYCAFILKGNDKNLDFVNLCSEEELLKYAPENELGELYELLWLPLESKLNNVSNIYYSPDGLLNNIPFHALYTLVNENRVYTADKYSLHQLISNRVLVNKQNEPQIFDVNIALFGGINYNDYPVLDKDTIIDQSNEIEFLLKQSLADKKNTRTGISFLPGTKKEINNISKLLKDSKWTIDVYENKAASENNFKALTGKNNRTILHIATHGFSFPDKDENKSDNVAYMIKGDEQYKAANNPMIRSGLLFSGANITWKGMADSLVMKTNEDGVLTAYELSQIDLKNTKLVILSACETGKGFIQGSEGTFGLKRALKLAGVDNMIVSLWKVPDDATMEMMTLFYNELIKTKKPISSFEKAQKFMRFKYPTEPKKWAGFVLIR